MKIAVIGAGNMGAAIAGGLARQDHLDIIVSNPGANKLQDLKEKYPHIQTTQDNRLCVKGADLILLAVKPWKMEEVLLEIRDAIDYKHVIIGSVAAGISTEQISGWLLRNPNESLPPVYCIMPNTAISVGQSMTFLCAARSTPEQDQTMESLFKSMGDTMFVEEKMMGAGMAIGSCGIAYAMRYIRAAMEGGVEMGIKPSDAQRIVEQTLLGAVELLRKQASHPEAEIDRVTTPGGFTIRGLNAMEENGFTNSVIQGIKASVKN